MTIVEFWREPGRAVAFPEVTVLTVIDRIVSHWPDIAPPVTHSAAQRNRVAFLRRNAAVHIQRGGLLRRAGLVACVAAPPVPKLSRENVFALDQVRQQIKL